jgi:hypothetical protein
MIIIMMLLTVLLLVVAGLLVLRLRLSLVCLGVRPLDDLVQFTPVKPDTPAFGTVIYFNSLAFCNFKIHSCAYRAFHGGISFKWE